MCEAELFESSASSVLQLHLPTALLQLATDGVTEPDSGDHDTGSHGQQTEGLF